MRRLSALLVSLLAAVAVAAEPAPSPWKISAGATVISVPRYPGADERRVLVVPSWDVVYRERWFSKGLDFAGVHFKKRGAWKSGAAIAWELDSRDESDAPRFEGLGDVESTMSAKLFGEWSRSLLTVSAAASHDLLGRGHGLTATLDASVAVPFFQPWFFAAGPGVSWIDGENAATFFGVDAEQSRRSGLPAHEAAAGIRDVRFTAVASRRLRGEWRAAAVTSLSRLRGDAASSPVTGRKDELSFVFTLSRRIR